MNKNYQNHLYLSLLLTSSLFASETTLQFEIVPFDYRDIAMKEQLCAMIRDDQEMAVILHTNEDAMKENCLLCPDLQYDVRSFICRSTDGSATIYGFIQYSQHDQFYEYGKLITIKEDAVGFINGLAVHKNYRRRGVAQALLHHVEEICKNNGIWRLMLFADIDNDRAVHAYKRYGFTIHPGYSTYLGLTMIKLIHEN